MHRHSLSVTVIVTLLCLALATPALAAQVNMKKVKKWPELDQVWARSLDAWMTDEELKLFLQIKTTEERKQFLVDAGYWRLWKKIDKDMVPNIIKGDVLKGMNKDEVFMCWDKPAKIRKDFRKDAYVDVLNYEFEIDRKGREFLMRKDSKTAYRNEIVTKYVYMYNGKVFDVVYAGEEEAGLATFSVDQEPTDEPAPDSDEEPAPAEEPGATDDAVESDGKPSEGTEDAE
ncbi:MAG TPA: hypothetical protein DIU15_05895 [Deltaproteobacteria bacterium]|nr:hypothetical protein [Deltaproteobacteria bacterium]HCP45551.1 hypothetical protein [Deltaproteobacteria bacterium]